jgi:hypothetical protein
MDVGMDQKSMKNTKIESRKRNKIIFKLKIKKLIMLCEIYVDDILTAATKNTKFYRCMHPCEFKEGPLTTSNQLLSPYSVTLRLR